MKFVCFSVLIVIYFAQESSSFSTLPSYMVPCSKSEPDFNACALKNGKTALPKLLDGDPEYNIPSFKPFRFDKLDLVASNAIKVYLTNGESYGFENFEIKSIDWNLDAKEVRVVLFTPEINSLGDYKIEGKILIMNLEGSGKMNNTYYDVTVDILTKYELESRDGKEYPNIKRIKIDTKVGNVHLDFSNLMNNPQLSVEMNAFLNENWKVLIEELIPSFDIFLEETIKNIINPITSKVPIDEIVKP